MVTPTLARNARDAVRRAWSMSLAALVGALLLVLASSGTANAQGFSLSRFEPSERGSRFFLADSLELHATNSSAPPVLAFGVVSSYAYRARTFGTPAEGGESRLVEHSLFLHPGASVVIAPSARFAIDVPVGVLQGGKDASLGGLMYRTPSAPSLGDIRASFDLLLLGPPSRDDEGIALAGGVNAWLPTGSGDNLTGDDGARFGVHFTSAARFKYILASATAGYMYRRDGNLGVSRLGSEVNAVLGVAYSNDGWTIGPELRAATLLYEPLKTRATPVELMLGARHAFGSLRVGAGIGTSLVSGLGAAHLRLMLSLEWAAPAPSPAGRDRDRDGDGVPDADDICPDVAGPSTGPPSSRGCPPAPVFVPDPDRGDRGTGEGPAPGGTPIQ